MALNIPGIDEGVFSDLMDSDEDLYISVVDSFIAKTPDVLKKLATVTKENLADYATTVHGLKGACANVCAEEARKAALELEQLSRAGDLAGVQAKNGAFLKNVETLLGNLQNWHKSH